MSQNCLSKRVHLPQISFQCSSFLELGGSSMARASIRSTQGIAMMLCPPRYVPRTYSNLDRSLVLFPRIVLNPLPVWVVLDLYPALWLLCLALKPQADFTIAKETRC